MTGNEAVSQRQRSRRNPPVDVSHIAGWDDPPSVSSPASNSTTRSLTEDSRWQSRTCRWKTPQLIKSLSVSVEKAGDDDDDSMYFSSVTCPPLLWQQRYIVLSMLGGDLFLFGNLMEVSSVNRLPSTAAPLATLTLPNDATIVSLVPLEDPDAESDTIVAVSSEGHIHRIRLHKQTDNHQPNEAKKPLDSTAISDSVIPTDGPSTSENKPRTTYQLLLESSWTTGSCGLVCVTSFLEDSEQSKLSRGAFGASSTAALVVGYESGHIEAWRIFLDKPKRRPKFLWRGWVEEVGSVKCLGTLIERPEVLKQGESPTNKRKNIAIIVGLESIITADPPTIHAFFWDGVQEAAKNISRPLVRGQSAEDSAADLPAFDLSGYMARCDPAMDLIEPTSHSQTPDSQQRQSTGMRTASRSQINQILSIPSDGKCGIALSDGTVALISPGWGVQDELDQALLEFPAIGLGNISLPSTRRSGLSDQYLACCLRAGTCYLVPSNGSRGKPEDIIVLSVPHDIDSDDTSRYVQGFTAGNIRIQDGDENLAVMVFVWPGGVVDIYRCDLECTTHSIPSIDEQVLETTTAQECLELIMQILQGMQKLPDHPLHNDPLWESAFAEMTSGALAMEYESQGLDAIRKLPAIGTLLVQLASTETRLENVSS